MFETYSGQQVKRLGMGTWKMGDDSRIEKQEIAALRYGIEQGVQLIDTAEMYGEGRSESLLGKAITPFAREDLYLVSKVLPYNADSQSMRASLQASLKRLKTDYLDMYLLHWPGSVPIEETIEAFQVLKDEGLIRAWGVSNYDTQPLSELLAVTGGEDCATNQVLYHLGSRGIEFSLKPLMDEVGMPLMAYCPLAQAGRLRENLLNHPAVVEVAQEINGTPYQVLLLFLLAQSNVYPIPKSSNPDNMASNLEVLEMTLSAEHLAYLEQHFPAPTYKMPLDIE